jgi:hypothetical protein
MKWSLKLEELAMLLMSIYFLPFLHAEWYWYVLLLIGTEISMMGYLLNKKTGAICYNFFHHKAVAITLVFICYFFPSDYLLLMAVVIFGHSSLDRFLGFGLKYFDGFNVTHLGTIGKGT